MAGVDGLCSLMGQGRKRVTGGEAIGRPVPRATHCEPHHIASALELVV
jgi:hypothetical protein